MFKIKIFFYLILLTLYFDIQPNKNQFFSEIKNNIASYLSSLRKDDKVAVLSMATIFCLSRAWSNRQTDRWTLLAGLSAYLQLLFLDNSIFNMEFSIPSDLVIKNFDIKQIRSLRQKNEMCTVYSILNARTIQDLVLQKNDFEVAYVEEYMRDHWMKHFHEVIYSQLSPSIKKQLENNKGLILEQQHELIKKVGLKHYNLIQVHFDSSFYCSDDPHSSHISLCKNSSIYRIDDFQGLLRDVIAKKTDVVHILLSSSCDRMGEFHAVLLSIINKKRPLILYMDSNNKSLSGYSLDYATPFYAARILMMIDKAYDELNNSLSNKV